MYSIGEISKKFNLPISTIRYYDKEGLLLNIERDSNGIRRFSDGDVTKIKVIECLKKTGMSLKDIKTFMAWSNMGDSTLEKRRDMFYARKEAVERQIEELKNVLEFTKYKCWYYDTACSKNTEKELKEMSIEIPTEFKEVYEELHK